MVKHLENESDFDKEINSGLVLVDFYADWCGPCKMLAPILEELDIDVVKVNTDKYGEIAMKYGILSIPTLILFKDGVEIAKEIGFRSKEELEELISKNS